jgi:hypothetical protein
VLSPQLSGARGNEADAFIEGLVSKLPPQHLHLITRDSELGLPEQHDVVVLLTPTEPEQPWRSTVRNYLGRALELGADIIPVALRRGQQPPPPLADRTPFPVWETFASYHLGPAQFGEAGAIFARVAVSRLWPTYSRERLRLFLSHRRADGEELVRSLASAIYDLNHRSSRDLADIRAGSRVTASLVDELDESDVLVLCDTPQAAGDRPWLKDELCVALGLGLPIVWARFGQVGLKSELPITPSDEPDLDMDWPADGDAYRQIAARIIETAFVSGRNQVRRMESYITRAGTIMELDVIDPRQRVLLLQRARRLGPYELMDRVVVQAYARRPTSADAEQLVRLLKSKQLLSQDGKLRSFDVAVILSPSPVCNRGVEGATSPVVQVEGVQSSHAGSLVTALTWPAGERGHAADSRELLLFAAIGPGQGAGQEFRDAVQDVATYWLGRGGRIRFGGHPTVTPTVNWVARSEVADREREHVTIYQSEYFVTPQLLSEISQIATVVGTAVQGSGPTARQESLTHMRERMVEESSAIAAIVIGGLTREESGRQPGVEEEMLLARRRGIPVFLLGATGGQAAVLVEQARAQRPPFAELGNGLSEEDNEFLATTDDYARAADMIWTATERTTD